MTQTTLAATERDELCDLMAEVGPDAPTLCPGWATRDLAAHLIVREGRPDAAPGMLIPPLAWYAERVQHATAQQPWPDLIEQVRTGPPWYSPMRLASGERINGVEFYVHHEDIRRARPGWQPRAADQSRADELWRMLGRMGRLCYRKSPVGVVVRRADDGSERTIRNGSRSVTVIGTPDELLMHAYGRKEAVVEFEGDQADIDSLEGSPRGF